MGIRTRRARKHSKTHVVGFGIAGVFGFIALFGLALAVSLGSLVDSWLKDLPDYQSADAYLVAEPTIVYDSRNNEIAKYYLQNRRSVELKDISKYVVEGTVDVEDERFRKHNGIDPQGILRAVVVNITGGSEGASTITQQLVRNTVLSDEQFEQTLKRKVREAYIAIQMEKTYSKDQILNMYLNTIYYGEGAYGIEAASITYFNKHANDLTLAEAATLVGIPNSPSYYDPMVNPEACKERRNKVLSNMLKMGDITQEQYDTASAEDLVLNPGSLQDSTVGAYPYFTDYVRNLLLEDFDKDTVLQGGLKVYTTLDPDKQVAAEEAVDDVISKAGNDEVSSALVSIDNTNGYIRAMVGGVNYGYDKSKGESSVNLATTRRQPGSSFKPFTLTAAIADGMNPDVILNCNSPIKITATWSPHNSLNAQFGYVTLERATQLSSNTGYAQVIMAIGVDKLIQTAHAMGIRSELQAVPSLVLGSSEVTPLEMCEAYTVFANNGIHRDAVAITKIEDRNGNVVYEHKDDPKQVIDAGVAQVARQVLESVVTAGYTTYYVHNNMTFNQPAGGKTGTSDEGDNLWFCGFTPQLTTVVWTGNRDNSQAVYYQGQPSYGSARTSQPIWTKYMNAVLDGVSRGSFPKTTEKPEYKPNSSWNFVGTPKSVNSGYALTNTDATTTDNQNATGNTTANGTNDADRNPGANGNGGGGNANGGNGGNNGGGNADGGANANAGNGGNAGDAPNAGGGGGGEGTTR